VSTILCDVNEFNGADFSQLLVVKDATHANHVRRSNCSATLVAQRWTDVGAEDVDISLASAHNLVFVRIAILLTPSLMSCEHGES
jgi:hypothetical protein